jgi:hypothetical protein
MKTANASDHGLLPVLGSNDTNDRIHLRTDQAIDTPASGNFIGRVDSSPNQTNLRIQYGSGDYYGFGTEPGDQIGTLIPTLTDNNWHQVTYQFDWDVDARAVVIPHVGRRAGQCLRQIPTAHVRLAGQDKHAHERRAGVQGQTAAQQGQNGELYENGCAHGRETFGVIGGSTSASATSHKSPPRTVKRSIGLPVSASAPTPDRTRDQNSASICQTITLPSRARVA